MSQLSAQFFLRLSYTVHIHVYCVLIIYFSFSFHFFLLQFDVYTKTLLKTIDLLLTLIDKAEFCKECAKIVKTIIESPVHCVYINDTIATLFEYMVYDFNGNF